MKIHLSGTLLATQCSYLGACTLPTHRTFNPQMLTTLTHAPHSPLAPTHLSPSLQTASNPKLVTHELKCLMPASKREKLMAWVNSNMSLDPHCQSPNGYQVQSLYLDTPNRDVLLRRDLCRGLKYRIRRYDHSEQVFLERKCKANSQLTKKRILIDKARLSELDCLPLHASHVDASQSFGDNWFYHESQCLSLQPVCLVQYQRQAYFLDTEHNALRLTIDGDLHSVACHSHRFADQTWRVVGEPQTPKSNVEPLDDPMQFVMQDYLVVELKFVDSIPSPFKQLLSEMQTEPVKFSKYRTAMLAHYSLSTTDVGCKAC